MAPSAKPDPFVTTTLAKRPDLKDAVLEHSMRLTNPKPSQAKEFGWPVFLYKGEGGSKIFDCCFGFPQFQVLIIHTDAETGKESLAAVGDGGRGGGMDGEEPNRPSPGLTGCVGHMGGHMALPRHTCPGLCSSTMVGKGTLPLAVHQPQVGGW